MRFDARNLFVSVNFDDATIMDDGRKGSSYKRYLSDPTLEIPSSTKHWRKRNAPHAHPTPPLPLALALLPCEDALPEDHQAFDDSSDSIQQGEPAEPELDSTDIDRLQDEELLDLQRNMIPAAPLGIGGYDPEQASPAFSLFGYSDAEAEMPIYPGASLNRGQLLALVVGYVMDSGVTFKWLSKTLAVHVNQAKQMLYNFVQQQRNEKSNDTLSATYLLTGVTDKNGQQVLQVEIVAEEDLEASKAKYLSLSSCHIYSVQRTKLKDTSAIYSSDYDLLKEHILQSNKFSAITCPHAKPHSGSDLQKLKNRNQVSKDVQSKPAPAFASGPPKKPVAAPPKKPAGIAGMFSKAAEPKKDQTSSSAAKAQEPEAKKAAEEKNQKSTAKNRGGVMSLFANQANKPKVDKKSSNDEKKTEESTKARSPESTGDAAKSTAKEQTEEATSPEEKSDAKPKAAKRPPAAAKQERSKGKKQKAASDDEDSLVPRQDKKRRRIKQRVFDSSSSEDEMEIENPIPSPPPPEPEVEIDPASPVRDAASPDFVANTDDEDEIPPTADDSQALRPQKVTTLTSPNANGVRRRVRKRKMVSKTFVNDEGFMETEKTWEDYSTDASEGEEVKETPVASNPKAGAKRDSKPEKRKSPNKKPSPNKASGAKQMSLMTFFKKK